MPTTRPQPDKAKVTATFRLSGEEFKALRQWREEIQAYEVQEAETLGGAGSSAVVLSTERFSPSDGVAIGSDDA